MLEYDNVNASGSIEPSSAPMLHRERSRLTVKVSRISREAGDILVFELVDPAGGPMPAFKAGAHIDVHLRDGLVRSYSLCSDPADRSHYQIAVLREANGRGGSKAMHEEVAVGGLITISAPKNFFPLAGREARAHLLLAGGIGVTPMMAMIAELETRGAPWMMHYCTRSPERTAFRRRLEPYIAAGKVMLHHDGGDPGRGLDIKALLSGFEIGTHLYYCGPAGFMSTCNAAVGAWPPHAVHREFFTAPAGALDAGPRQPFQVKLKSSGPLIDVPAEKSLVDVLREAGCEIETDCMEGYCGTCITRYTAGQPEHHDTVLSEAERKNYVMVCCARARGVLELDL